jgi:hypothetical protein
MEEENKIEKIINHVKKTIDLCNTFCCYEDCEKCVRKYLEYKEKK